MLWDGAQTEAFISISQSRLAGDDSLNSSSKLLLAAQGEEKMGPLARHLARTAVVVGYPNDLYNIYSVSRHGMVAPMLPDSSAHYKLRDEHELATLGTKTRLGFRTMHIFPGAN